MKKLIEMKKKAFTLVEMLVVLGIISVLLLLFVPNLSRQKDTVKKSGNAAVVKIIESQMEIYELEHNGARGTVDQLQSGGYITADQAKTYKEHAALKANAD